MFTDTVRPNVTNTETASYTNSRFIGGVQGGYNWQFDPRWVAGVEADWDWMNASYSDCRKTISTSVACRDNGLGFITYGGKVKLLGSLRGRLGVTWDRWMLYGTGGLAWGRVETDLAMSCLVNGCGSSLLPTSGSTNPTETKTGWVAGLGLEAILTGNWTARAEWLHTDLGTISATLPLAGNFGGVASTQTASWSQTVSFDQFRIGINYLFK